MYFFAAKCEEPMVNSNVSLDYNSTVEGSLLIFWCSDGLFPNGVILAQCTKRGVWMPNPAELECSVSLKSTFKLILPPACMFYITIVMHAIASVWSFRNMSLYRMYIVIAIF